MPPRSQSKKVVAPSGTKGQVQPPSGNAAATGRPAAGPVAGSPHKGSGPTAAVAPVGVSTSPHMPPEPKFPSFPGPMLSPPLVPLGESLAGGQHVIPAAPLWSGGSLQAGTTVNVPLTLAGLVLAFALTQWLIDRRDPKFVEAPIRKDDDSLGFE